MNDSIALTDMNEHNNYYNLPRENFTRTLMAPRLKYNQEIISFRFENCNKFKSILIHQPHMTFHRVDSVIMVTWLAHCLIVENTRNLV